jgi:drug/metabolite transporter (DMT)-like permease
MEKHGIWKVVGAGVLKDNNWNGVLQYVFLLCFFLLILFVPIRSTPSDPIHRLQLRRRRRAALPSTRRNWNGVLNDVFLLCFFLLILSAPVYSTPSSLVHCLRLRRRRRATPPYHQPIGGPPPPRCFALPPTHC